MDNFGDSTLRWPDGVDVIEAESNPAHGQYIGNWAPVSACGKMPPVKHPLKNRTNVRKRTFGKIVLSAAIPVRGCGKIPAEKSHKRY